MPSIDGRRIILYQSQSYKQETCSVAIGPGSATERVAIWAIRGQGTQADSELTVVDGTCSYVNYVVASNSFDYEYGVPVFCAVGETASIACSGSGSSVCVTWGSQQS